MTPILWLAVFFWVVGIAAGIAACILQAHTARVERQLRQTHIRIMMSELIAQHSPHVRRGS